MPKVIGHTPPWLSHNTAGAAIFSVDSEQSSSSRSRTTPSPSRRTVPKPEPNSPREPGPKRLIARRGTEVFVLVGSKIRWANLAKVQYDWETRDLTRSGQNQNQLQGDHDQSQKDENVPQCYRSLDVSVPGPDIRELVISPSGHFLAICAEHTIRIAILPDSSRLVQDRSMLKLKTFQLGPTTHAKPESPLASVLWHPLAASTPSSDCLVTVTSKAAVRVWEIDRTNQWSFERPALAIDLRKLADGVSCNEDFQPSEFGKNRGFSVDDVDMEVAVACFGGSAYEDEDPWASMTLWTAMINGDMYALCPLLPSKWCPTSTTIPSLSTSIVSRMATVAAEEVDPADRQEISRQYEWVQEIDDEEPIENAVFPQDAEVRFRPENPSAIPRLQGPFSLNLEDEEADFEVTDLAVFPAHIDEGDLYSGEDDYDDMLPTGIPFTTILLATSDKQTHIALSAEGISGQWLPKRVPGVFTVPIYEAKLLALVDTVVFEENQLAKPPFLIFSSDPIHRYSVFVTDGSSVQSISLDDWALRVSEEVAGNREVDAGLKTRLQTSCKSQIAVVEKVLSTGDPGMLSAPIILSDSHIGYFLLTASSSAPFAVSLDQPHLRSSMPGQSPADFAKSTNLGMQLVRLEVAEESNSDSVPTRPIYSPPRIFDYHGAQPISEMLKKFNPKQRTIVKEKPMRLSPALLEVMTSAHRTISRQTADLEDAAAELFRRCDRLRTELGEHVKQMAELADRLQRLRNGDDGGYGPEKKEQRTTDMRLKAAKERQVVLVKRYEALRKKVGRVGIPRKELSAKEIAWAAEIEALNDSVGHDTTNNDSSNSVGTLTERYNDVKQLASELLEQSRRLQNQQEGDLSKSVNSGGAVPGLQRSDSTASPRSGVGSTSIVSARYQREKIAEVMASVEREGAIIDAVMGRLEKFRVSTNVDDGIGGYV